MDNGLIYFLKNAIPERFEKIIFHTGGLAQSLTACPESTEQIMNRIFYQGDITGKLHSIAIKRRSKSIVKLSIGSCTTLLKFAPQFMLISHTLSFVHI